MEDWPPELAQCVFYTGWSKPADILSLCCASKAMTGKLLGDKYARDNFKSFASVNLLCLHEEYGALRIGILRGRIVPKPRGQLFVLASFCPDIRLAREIYKRLPVTETAPVWLRRTILDHPKNFDVWCEYMDFTVEPLRNNILATFCINGLYDRLMAFGEKYGLGQTNPDPLTGNSLLHYACKSDSVDLVKLFLHQGVNALNQFNWTPFLFACVSKHWNVFEFLLALPETDVLRHSHDDRNVLALCMQSNDQTYHLAKVKLLLETGLFDVNITGLNNPLFQACAKVSGDVIRYLVTRPDVDINARVGNTRPLLKLCDSTKSVSCELVALFLERPDLDLKCDYVFAAAENGRKDFFEMFLTHPGILLDPKCLCKFATFSDPYYIKHFLEHTGFNVNGTRGDSLPLLFACQYESIEVVRFLLTQPNIKLRADLNCVNPEIRSLLVETGWTPPRKRHTIMSYY
ncbi:MAG: hypothetical protein CMP20_01530 [Rickettsiales bacterium]|nr:hypothetical protein [Rickettsiales bacterium]